MTQQRRQEIKDAGFEVVATADRQAHTVGGGCWNDDEVLIGLGSMDEAQEHGYTPCEKCGSRTSARETRRETRDDGGSASAE